MANSYFQFKQFTIYQDKCAMKVTTDGCLFGAWAAERVGSLPTGQAGQESGAGSILDIGTGTGLLSLMLAQQNPGAFVDTIEIDKDAFEQASSNVAASPWVDRVKIIHADAKEFESRHKYDVIVSNPPFYENELKGDDAKKNIAQHNEGLLLPDLLAIIKKNLESSGVFFLLLPYKRNAAIKKLLLENDLAIQQLCFVRQSVNHDYIRIMLLGQLKTKETIETQIDEISIRDDKQEYTAAFTALLSKYYLHL